MRRRCLGNILLFVEGSGRSRLDQSRAMGDGLIEKIWSTDMSLCPPRRRIGEDTLCMVMAERVLMPEIKLFSWDVR